MESAYLKVSEIAKMTGIRAETVRRWCRDGKLKSVQPTGKDRLIKREDFEAFMTGEMNEEE